MVDDGISITGRTEAGTALRYTTDSATFDGQGNGISDTFFTGNGSNVFRSADAEVDDSVFGQFQSTAATDNFLSAHRESCVSSAFRSTMFAAKGRIIFAVIRLLMVFRSSYDNVINIDARNLDHARVEAAVSNDIFDLDDDFTATVVNGLGYGSAFERPDFFVHGDIAGFISIRTAEESYVDREGRVEKLFMTIDFDQFDEVFFGYVIELAAELTGIEKSFQTDVGEDAELMTCQGAEPVDQRALREVVSFNLVFDSQFTDSRYSLPVTDDGAFQKACVCQMFSGTAIAFALRACIDVGQVLRGVRVQEPFFQSFGQCFRMGAADKANRRNRVVVFYELSCLFSCNDFYFSHYRNFLLLNGMYRRFCRTAFVKILE